MKIIAILALFISSSSFAAPSTSSGSDGMGASLRLIGGASTLSPSEVNDSFEAQNLKKVSAGLLLGGEIGYAFNRIELGARYLNHQVSSGEETEVPSYDYTGAISQDLLFAMVHIPVMKKDWMRFEVFGGYGTAGSRIKVKSASQRGELNRRTFSTAISTAGVALAFGYKNFFINFEGGYLDNNIKNFSRSGTIGDEIQSANLGGTYAGVSLLFFGGNFGKAFDFIGRNTGMVK